MGLQRVGLFCERGKILTIVACCLCRIYSSLFPVLTSLFLFSPFFPFRHFILMTLVTILFPLMGTIPIYTKSSLHDLYFLLLLLTNHFCLLQTLLKSAYYPSGRMGSTSTTSKHVHVSLSTSIHPTTNLYPSHFAV